MAKVGVKELISRTYMKYNQ